MPSLPSFSLAFIKHSWKFVVFHFPPIMAKRLKLTEDDISQLLDESEDECKEIERGSLAPDDNGEIAHASEILDHESSGTIS